MNTRPKVYPAEEVERVRSLYWDQGMALPDVAKEMGRSRNYVRRIMLNHDIDRRGMGKRAVEQDAQPVGFRNRLAYCRNLDPAVFFAESAAGAAAAADICRTHCLVMEGCLRYAVQAGEHGVWGGCNDQERNVIAERWNGLTPLVRECESCERSFVPLVDGLRVHCTSADEEVA